jgi:hypothetical protein
MGQKAAGVHPEIGSAGRGRAALERELYFPSHHQIPESLPSMNTQAINPAETGAETSEWIQAVGGFFRNFALIELLTVEFVVRMADSFKYKSMKKKFLPQRLTWIADSIHEHCQSDPDKIASLIEILDAIREASYFRNVLAHGAAGFAFPGGADAEPSLTGVLNFKPDDETQDAEMVSLEEIQGRRDESASLARQLLESLNGLELTKLVQD